jgi:hypothetical protein
MSQDIEEITHNFLFFINAVLDNSVGSGTPTK